MSTVDHTKTSNAPFPVGWGTLIGLCLGLSGQLPTAILAFFLWLGLRAMRDGASSNILLATSILISGSTLGLIWHMSHASSATAIVEVFLMLVFAVILFFTDSRILAAILLLHSAWNIYVQVTMLFTMESNPVLQRLVLGNIIVNALIVYFLFMFIACTWRERQQVNLEKNG